MRLNRRTFLKAAGAAAGLAAQQADRVKAMRADLEVWLTSVVRSLNGEDYR